MPLTILSPLNLAPPFSAGGGENEPPSADFSWSEVDYEVSFTDLSVDADGSVQSWEWDFGDGATSIERHPVHTYAVLGDYDVTLSVLDDMGAPATITRTITVTGPLALETINLPLLFTRTIRKPLVF